MRPINEQRRSELTDAAIDIVVRSRDGAALRTDEGNTSPTWRSRIGKL